MVAQAYNPPYDPHRHVTARQLRDLGFLLGENIPDEAYVRRVAVDLNGDELLDDGSTVLGLSVLEPFVGMETAIYEPAACW